MAKKSKKTKNNKQKLSKSSKKKNLNTLKKKQKAKLKKGQVIRTVEPTVDVKEAPEFVSPSPQLIDKTIESLNQLSELLSSLNNAPIIYKNEAIFPAELTALKQIHLDQPTNAVTLAGHLGVTKSAALKTANKLNFKGLVNKDVNPETKTIRLTVNEDGEAVLKQVPKFNEKNKAIVLETLKKIPESALLEFDNVLDIIINNCNNSDV